MRFQKCCKSIRQNPIDKAATTILTISPATLFKPKGPIFFRNNKIKKQKLDRDPKATPRAKPRCPRGLSNNKPANTLTNTAKLAAKTGFLES